MKKLVFLVLAVLLMTGCSKTNKQTATCTYDSGDGMTSELVFSASDDVVTKSVEEIRMSYEALGATSDSDKETLRNYFIEMFSDYEGITIEATTGEEELLIVLTIDYTTVDYQSLVDLGMMSEDDLDQKFVDLQLSMEGLEDTGYTCGEVK